jgi:tripartite-type tricarboxylate transporter receptor subunit TctC
MKSHAKKLALLTLVWGLASASAWAQSYPSRPIRLIIGYGAGGVTDVLARIVASEVGTRINGSVVVENRPGANAQIAAQMVKTSAPDGYTWYTGSTLTFSPTFMKDAPISAVKEMQPVSTTGTGDWFIYAPGTLPIASLTDLQKYGKSQSVRFASPSPANTMLMTVVAKRLGIPFENIPYKTTDQTIQALISGDAQITINAVSGFEGQVSAGKLRAIANLGESKSPLMPAAAPAKDQGIPLECRFAHGIWVALGTPNDIVSKISAATIDAMKSPSAMEKAKNIGLIAGGSTPAGLLKATEDEAKFYNEAAEASGFKPQ